MGGPAGAPAASRSSRKLRLFPDGPQREVMGRAPLGVTAARLGHLGASVSGRPGRRATAGAGALRLFAGTVRAPGTLPPEGRTRVGTRLSATSLASPAVTGDLLVTWAGRRDGLWSAVLATVSPSQS